MEEELKIPSGTYQLERYPVTTDRSLRAWSNAELLVLEYISDLKFDKVYLFNDRFGVWNCALETKKQITIFTYASQKQAILNNLKLNNSTSQVVFKTPLDNLSSVDVAFIKIPKSLELFELFLKQIHNSANDKTLVVCGFMLKYFSPSFLKIANIYFEEVTQTKAWKKARLLVLKKPKALVNKKELIKTVFWNSVELKQYYGVFSSDKIDIGTRFFIENMNVHAEEKNILDLASGNGILAYEALKLHTEAKVTLVDDFNLAIASSKLNIPKEKATFICAENLKEMKGHNFDLVISNPPFHFEHENNIEITLLLFKGVKDCLKLTGRFLLVANLHLNYKTHLEKLFTTVTVVNSNTKFIIYECLNN